MNAATWLHSIEATLVTLQREPIQIWQERFTWGRGSIVAASETRQAYVRALNAGAGDIAPLLEFACR